MGCHITPHVLKTAVVHAWDFFNFGMLYFNYGACLLLTRIGTIIMAKISSHIAAYLSQHNKEHITRSWTTLAVLGYLGTFYGMYQYYSSKGYFPGWALVGFQVFVVELLTNLLLLCVVCIGAGFQAVEVRYLTRRTEKAKEDGKGKEGKVKEGEDNDLVLIAKQ